MTFAGDLKAFNELVHRRLVDAVTLTGLEVQRSVVEGSALTGAPGQPVDTGALRGSFIPERESELVFRITSGLDYAGAIEDGIGPHGPMTLRSAVGGFHSVKLTEAGWPRIVDHVAKKVAPNG